MISPGFAEMAEHWHMSYNTLNGGLSWAIFTIGLSCFVTNGLSVKYGRRPVMIAGNLMLFISSVWAYFAHSYHSLLASRIFGAVGMSPFEVLTTAIIGDIYFVHERGLRLAFWGLCLNIGVGGGSCISGYIIQVRNTATIAFFLDYFRDLTQKCRTLDGIGRTASVRASMAPSLS
jgi:MFS family permease